MKRSSLSRRDFFRVAGAAALLPTVSQTAIQVKDPKASTRGLFMHVWDLVDEDIDSLMSWMHDSNLNQMCIASSYHSGWFVHPHAPKHRLHLAEGGVLYFPPDKKLYRNTAIRPLTASFVGRNDFLAKAGQRLERHGLQMVSWTIGAHSTRLGQLYPQFTQHNAFGDSLPHALSIGHDATREYLKALCRDLATHYPFYGLQLESFAWSGIRHGHHHERDLTALTPFEADLLSICFNPQTVQKAQAAGVDAQRARAAIKEVLDAAFREAPDRPQGHPRSMAELEERSGDVKAYNLFRRKLADSLIVEIRQQSLAGTTCKLLMQGGYRKELDGVAQGFGVGVYGQLPEQVLENVSAARRQFPAGWQGDFPCFVRLGTGVPASQQQLVDIVRALLAGGASGPIFYNYSESPRRMLNWIRGALEGL
ncbi:MAG: hypothetical protein ACR2L2_18645 [Acidobacteriota bacterium]